MDGVLGGSVVANARIRRWASETAPGLSTWTWERLDQYAETLARLPMATGSRAGQPLALLPWQWAATAQLLCDPGCKVLVLIVARGAGKTEWAASVCAHLLRLSQAAEQYYLVGPDLRAASHAFIRLQQMVPAVLPDAKISEAVGSTTGGRVRLGAVRLTALPCTESAMDGLVARLIVADEVLRMKKALGRAMTGLAKTPDAQLLAISTPDSEEHLSAVAPYYSTLRSHYLDGSADLPDGWRGMVYGIDDDDHPLDESCWIKAQPSLGHTVRIEDMRSSVRSLLESHNPSLVNECNTQQLCRSANLTPSGVDSALIERQFQAWDQAAHAGRPAVIAIDLSKGSSTRRQSDLTSLAVYVHGEDDRIYCESVHWWAGLDPAADERSCAMPLRRWLDQGAVRWLGGETQDLDAIRAEVDSICRRYRVVGVGVDPLAHQERTLRQWMTDGVPIRRVDQGIRTMGPAWAVWLEWLRAKRLVIRPDPVLLASLKHIALIQDNAGNTRVAKGRSSGNTDPVVAHNMAAIMMERQLAAGISSYESSPIL